MTGNVAAVNLELMMPLLRQYNGVRTTCCVPWFAISAWGKTVAAAPQRAMGGGVDALEREYSQIPVLVDAARAGSMSVHEYVLTEVAFVAAVRPDDGPPTTDH